MWIRRTIVPELARIARSFPVVVLTGPRQVGKTTLAERAFPDHTYVSLDVGAQAELAETRPEAFLEPYPPPLVVDEVQYAPSFFRAIKTFVDARRGEHGLFVLTGSQNYALMESVSESLAGRAAVIPFLGLSGVEWRDRPGTSGATAAPPTPTDWRDFLWRGSYPGLWANPDAPPDRDRWYQGYLASYLERDVRNLMNVASLRDFERFLRAAAARVGQTLNVADLARDVGVSPTTAKSWLGVLAASNQVLLLEPYHRSLGKRLVKTPKLYFTDTGLAAFLMGFQSADSLWRSRDAGRLWECYVVSQWLRWRDWLAPSATLWYWRDRAGHEVDLLVELDQSLVAVECKLAERPGAADAAGIDQLRRFYGPDYVSSAWIACPTPSLAPPYEVAPGVHAVSGWTTFPVSLPSPPS